jgi:5-formyltetrahydrofolate cyclo-ligase
MHQKNQLRKKYFNLRKKKHFDIEKIFFLPLLNLIHLKIKKKSIKIALYYPSNYELNVLKLLEFNYFLKQDILLPVVDKNNFMNFFPWKKNDILFVNQFGILEPVKSKAKVPDLILVPLLAFDKKKYRLGYGKGYYDRYLNKHIKRFKNILTVGIAFSFQRHHKLPINKKDVKLDFIITEKGIN